MKDLCSIAIFYSNWSPLLLPKFSPLREQRSTTDLLPIIKSAKDSWTGWIPFVEHAMHDIMNGSGCRNPRMIFFQIVESVKGFCPILFLCKRSNPLLILFFRDGQRSTLDSILEDYSRKLWCLYVNSEGKGTA